MGNAVKKITKPITSIFEPPKAPKIPNIIQRVADPVQQAAETVTEAPSRAADPVQEAAEETRKRLRQGRGRASTIITALEGQLPAGSVIRKTLLGGS